MPEKARPIDKQKKADPAALPTPGKAAVDEYVIAAEPAVRPILQRIRRIVRQTVPDAQETIGYKMPAFRRGRIFLYVAAFKNHIGVYPPLTSHEDLRKDLRPYANEKGNLRFPLDQPMPYDLIARVAEALAAQYSR